MCPARFELRFAGPGRQLGLDQDMGQGIHDWTNQSRGELTRCLLSDPVAGLIQLVSASLCSFISAM